MMSYNNQDNEKLYKCTECGLHYRDKELAKKCAQWCGEHQSCNLEITSHAIENNNNSHDTPNEDKPVMYTCPMHPQIRQDKPGMCPECGMSLVPDKKKKKSKKHSEHSTDKHAGHSTTMFFIKFWISLILTIPVVLYADIVEKIFNWSPPAFFGSEYMPLIFASVVFFYGGWVFLVGAYRELRAKLPGMMTLIGIAISAAYIWSVYAVFNDEGALFWELTTLITIMLLGHWLEMRAVSGAQGALKELSKLLPDTAEVIRNGETKKIPLAQLKENDIVLVKPGTKIPADGVISEGESDINESMITGESRPVSKKEQKTF